MRRPSPDTASSSLATQPSHTHTHTHTRQSHTHPPVPPSPQPTTHTDQVSCASRHHGYERHSCPITRQEALRCSGEGGGVLPITRTIQSSRASTRFHGRLAALRASAPENLSGAFYIARLHQPTVQLVNIALWSQSQQPVLPPPGSRQAGRQQKAHVPGGVSQLRYET